VYRHHFDDQKLEWIPVPKKIGPPKSDSQKPTVKTQYIHVAEPPISKQPTKVREAHSDKQARPPPVVDPARINNVAEGEVWTTQKGN
jgi:hypothetical protein